MLADVTQQSWLLFAIWGLLGGLLVDGLEFWGIVRANSGRCPERYRTLPFVVAEILRLGAGAVLAVAFGTANQATAPLGVMAIGMAAPLVVEKLSQRVPSFVDQSVPSDQSNET